MAEQNHLSIAMDQRQQLSSTTTDASSSTSSQRPLSSSSFSAAMSATSTSTSAASESDRKKALAIANLMSPPEQPLLDTFVQLHSTPSRSSMGKKVVPNAPLSPPISPYTSGGSTIDAATNAIITVGAPTDPILYPSSDHSSSPPQPLFSPNEKAFEFQSEVDEHIANRSSKLFQQIAPPRREEYELILHVRASVMPSFVKNRSRWHKREYDQLLKDARARALKRSVQLPLILPASRPTDPRPAANRVTKPEKPKIKRAPRPLPAKIAPQSTTGPRQAATIRVSATPEPRARVVAPNREDKDFNSLPDYCPPLDSLPNEPNSLRVDWRGAPLDLSQDANRHLLHHDELQLASRLRLDCATYLTTKRRIFEKRLECLGKGKEFRKTDAQQACKIDVNKASKLWSAFEKVGWLNAAWVKPFLK